MRCRVLWRALSIISENIRAFRLKENLIFADGADEVLRTVSERLALLRFNQDGCSLR